MPEEIKKEKKEKWTFYLMCTKCSFKFSIERDSSDMKKVDITKFKCMECGEKVMWDTINFPSAVKPSSESQGKMNKEATNIALRMAAEQKKIDAGLGIDKMIPVTNYQEGKNRGQTEMVPEKVVESILQKVGPEIENLE